MFKRAQSDSATLEVEDYSASSSSGSDTEELTSSAVHDNGVKGWKTILIGNRNMSFNTRKLLQELNILLPHSKKESKYEGQRKEMSGLIEICELSNSEYCAYFHEGRDSIYLNLASVKGPSAKYELASVYRADEQGFDGNSSKSTRPLLMFSPYFFNSSEGHIHRSLLSRIFGAPLNHRKVRPYFDRIFYFFYTKNGIVFRNYEIQSDFTTKEIGPRFILIPKLIQEGPFIGKVLWKSPISEVTPSQLKNMKKAAFGSKIKVRTARSSVLEEKKSNSVIRKPEYEDIIFS